jgi:hypothetical protein
MKKTPQNKNMGRDRVSVRWRSSTTAAAAAWAKGVDCEFAAAAL